MRVSLSSGSVVATAWLLVSCAPSVEDGSAELPSATGPSASGSGSVEADAATPLNSNPDPDSNPDSGTNPDPNSGTNSNPDSDSGTNPVVTLPAQSVVWKTLAAGEDQRTHFSSPSVGSRGEEAAVAYVESVGDVLRILIQRFDAQGERLGEAVALGAPPDEYVGLTLASDGKQYGVCWSDTQIHCATLDAENQAHTAVLTLAGQYPKIAFAHGGWVLSYFTANEQIHLQALSDTLEVQGQPMTYNGSLDDRHAPLLVPTESGFALVGARPSNDQQAYLYRLGADLKLTAEPQPLGLDFWFHGDLAATDSRAAVSLAVPYGSYTLLLDAKGIQHKLGVGGGGKTGMYLALTARDGGIASAWPTRNGQLKTRFFADGAAESDLLAPTETVGTAIGLLDEGMACYQQFVQVSGQTLLVAYQNMDNACSGALRVTTLTTR